MKKGLMIGATLLMGLSLAACGNSKVDNGDGASSSSAVSKNKASSSKEVTNGSPEKVGQWKYFEDFDANGTLEKVNTFNKEVKQGDVTVTIKNVKVYSMKPKNDNAKKIASEYFNASGVNNPYYVVQVNWSAKNAGSEELQTNGLENIVTNKGQQIDTGSGLQDAGTGATVASGASSEFEANGLIKGATAKDINKLTLKFGSICTTSDYTDVSPEVTGIELDLK
ncbi:hypothetical protein [Loigolactobacillus bifermentans]|uniref:Lipoprotein n=1 Tax=Loigolactobacillus bifermentans DSM 20003 TaxID=1423726 RepID=A0A0R1H8P0_9LACO|nr:hypothetical protein [Loigolactobacillus bifermentans]KRK39986.1 hypothetical protein FC07_GL001784 [Loigolactobacillus bifermentans DSM 20003]QGG59684.1 hypothetical protein LB003_03845 [Loigolactobacillus bifermentans]